MKYDTFVGKEYEAFTIEVEKGRIGLFAGAIGVDDPIYSDGDLARAAGYHAVPAPPTFPYSITMDAGQSFNVLDDLGIRRETAVHGGQRFVYHNPICAGDTVTGRQKVVDIHEKKGGALIFIETETRLWNQDGNAVCDLYSTIIVRNGE